jgi:hypothetical protein
MIKVSRVFWGIIGGVMLIMIVPLSFFGFYLYWVPHIQEHISREIGFFDTVNVGLINLILYVLVAIKFIKPSSIKTRMFLMSVIPIAFLNIYLIEYKHFLIYYKNFTYKIIFLKEGKEYWTWKYKDIQEIEKKYTTKFIIVPDKYKSYTKDELVDLLMNNKIATECDTVEIKKEITEGVSVKVDKYVCKSKDGLKYISEHIETFKIKNNIVDNPDECVLKIIDIKKNSSLMLCRKGSLWFIKTIRYGTNNRIVYQEEKFLEEIRNIVSNQIIGR